MNPRAPILQDLARAKPSGGSVPYFSGEHAVHHRPTKDTRVIAMSRNQPFWRLELAGSQNLPLWQLRVDDKRPTRTHQARLDAQLIRAIRVLLFKNPQRHRLVVSTLPSQCQNTDPGTAFVWHDDLAMGLRKSQFTGLDIEHPNVRGKVRQHRTQTSI